MKSILKVLFITVILFIRAGTADADPRIPSKEHCYYEVHAVENGSLKVIITGPKLVHEAISHVMKARGVTEYSLRPARIDGQTVISAYRNKKEGYVPFFMFHRMNGNTRDPYGITPENFKLFLDALKANNFFPIAHSAIYNADFSDVPSGFHPCCIIVDDLDRGWRDFADLVVKNFGRDINGRIPVTFSVPFEYYGRRVFSSRETAVGTLRWILDNAYLANHSLEHKPLTAYRTAAGDNGGIDTGGFIQEQIDGWYSEAFKFIGKEAYAVDTFVLPEGIGLTNDVFMRRMEDHPYVRHVVGVVDSISDPWNGPVYRYIVNNSLWKQAVARAADEDTYIAGIPENIERYAVFIIRNREEPGAGGLPVGVDTEKLPVYVIVKKAAPDMFRIR